MGRNPAWHAQQRARGICYICQREMADDEDRLAHTECSRERTRGRSTDDIRRNPPALRAPAPKDKTGC
jgi:hypothetical protein